MDYECSIIAKLCRFSDETLHIPGTKSIAEFSEDENDFLIDFSFSVYGNGDSPENQGYVSLSIHFRSVGYIPITRDAVSTCFVSVIDIDKKERFTRSFNRESKRLSDMSFDISKYIARKALVEEASELLPDNCLTIRIGIIHQIFSDMKYSGERTEFIENVKRVEKESSLSKLILNLDSEVGRRLYEESTFFKHMIDNTSGNDMEIPIPLPEFAPFSDLYMIIKGSVTMQFPSLVQLRDIYELADKYGIRSAVETCRTFIKLYFNCRMRDEAFDKFSSIEGDLMLRVADMTGDDFLKEITNNFMQRNYAYFEEKGKIEWECVVREFIGSTGIPGLYIAFRKDHQEGFNFYS